MTFPSQLLSGSASSNSKIEALLLPHFTLCHKMNQRRRRSAVMRKTGNLNEKAATPSHQAQRPMISGFDIRHLGPIQYRLDQPAQKPMKGKCSFKC